MNAVRFFLISSVTLERDSDCACDPHGLCDITVGEM